METNRNKLKKGLNMKRTNLNCVELLSNSSGFGSEFGLTLGQHRPIRETETKGLGAEECGSNLMI